MAGPAFDVALAIRRVGVALRRDFAAIVGGGFVAVALPALALGGIGAGDDRFTLAVTARGVLAMLYVAVVAHGVVARLAGAPLPPRAFVAQGLARARPGLIVGLLFAAAIVVVMIVELAGRAGTAAGTLLHALAAAGVIWAVCVLLPAIPAAVAERLGPIAALRRAADLTRGSRDRILALLAIAAFTLAPAAALIALLAEGGGGVAGRWPTALFELLAAALLSTLPPVVYQGLREVRAAARSAEMTTS